MKILSALAVSLLALSARADVLFTKKIERVPSAAEAAPQAEHQTVWVGKDCLRLEKPRATYIVRFDLGKLFVLFPDQSYSAVDLPVDLKSLVPPDRQLEYEELRSKLALTARVTPTGVTGKHLDWNTKKFTVLLESAVRVEEGEFWSTTDIQIDWDLYWRAISVIMSLQPSGEAAAVELRKLEGLTVRAEKKVRSGDSEVVIREELLTLERKPAPEGLYDVPTGYKQKALDVLPELRAAARPRGEKPKDQAPKEGEPKKREKQGEAPPAKKPGS